MGQVILTDGEAARFGRFDVVPSRADRTIATAVGVSIGAVHKTVTQPTLTPE